MEKLKTFWKELSPQSQTLLTGALVGASTVLVLFVLWSVL